MISRRERVIIITNTNFGRQISNSIWVCRWKSYSAEDYPFEVSVKSNQALLSPWAKNIFNDETFYIFRAYFWVLLSPTPTGR